MQEPRCLPYAKRMRSSPTDTETRLWRNLRAGRLAGYKFRRQQPLGRFIVDFVGFEHRLIIVVGCGQHADAQAADDVRTAWLQARVFE